MAGKQESGRRTAGAFDIRTFIAALIGFYGVVLVLTGLFGTTDAMLAKADGININIWAGVAMIVFAATFIAWARIKPVVVADDDGDETESVREPNQSGH